jgi:hypothetical protein
VYVPPDIPNLSLPMRVCVCDSPFFEYLCLINASNAVACCFDEFDAIIALPWWGLFDGLG